MESKSKRYSQKAREKLKRNKNYGLESLMLATACLCSPSLAGLSVTPDYELIPDVLGFNSNNSDLASSVSGPHEFDATNGISYI